MPDSASPSPTQETPTERHGAGMALAALGIVYGDLGTSPLYTYQTIVTTFGSHPTATDAMGLLSLVVWALLITVSAKYCLIVMRADNHGEGGILALMSLVVGPVGMGKTPRWSAALTAMGLFGAALIYGDGIITPAISVLSALEGVDIVTSVLKPYVLPAALLILLALFAAQTRGTASIGRVFGPVMAVWFVVVALLGLGGIIRHPEVVGAIDPRYALAFLATHGWQNLVVLGGVFLAITGGEALYADMGHIGRGPIRFSWYAIVLPALLLSYAGQTALLIDNPKLGGNPFFLLCPGWAVIPLVVLATFATIIASQAIITGAFSLTRQAMQLGWFPGLTIRQTSDQEYGQIYVPFLNWVMMLGTLLLTYGFGSSDRLAGAYGTAVSTTMMLTTALLYDAMRTIWRWPVLLAGAVCGLFLLVDLGFFVANFMKIADGGWIPLILGVLLFLIMTTWHQGIAAVRRKLMESVVNQDVFMAQLREQTIPRVPGTAVFLSRSGRVVPPLLVRHVAQIKALQQTVVSLSVTFEERPRVPEAERTRAQHLSDGFWYITVRFGFVEVPNLAAALAHATSQGCPLNLDDAVYFAAHDEVIPGVGSDRLPGWRRLLFRFMFRNAIRTPDRFSLPADKFIEIGRQIAL
jgi:KUP system potassium uptake protein